MSCKDRGIRKSEFVSAMITFNLKRRAKYEF